MLIVLSSSLFLVSCGVSWLGAFVFTVSWLFYLCFVGFTSVGLLFTSVCVVVCLFVS